MLNFASLQLFAGIHRRKTNWNADYPENPGWHDSCIICKWVDQPGKRESLDRV